MRAELIRLTDPATPLYRTFRLKHFASLLEARELVLVGPELWEDPYENMLSKYALVIHRESGPVTFTTLASARRPMFAQCWSLEAESDALWRIYSTVVKDPYTGRNGSYDDEGIKVRTTVGKLLSAVQSVHQDSEAMAAFLGAVRYLPEGVLKQHLANHVGRDRLDAFSGPLGHAESLLVKRDPFLHEHEVRLIIVDMANHYAGAKMIPLPVLPEELIEEVILDPRLGPDDERQRRADFARLGYTGLVTRSSLYQNVFVRVELHEQPNHGAP